MRPADIRRMMFLGKNVDDLIDVTVASMDSIFQVIDTSNSTKSFLELGEHSVILKELFRRRGIERAANSKAAP